MTWTTRRLMHRVKINGDVVLTGEVRISESIDQLSRVAEFSLSQQPENVPVEGDTVLIESFDFTADVVRSVYGGTVNAITTESFPWSMTLVCTDQLRLLDRVRQSTDLDLTGMTPKEALMAVLDSVGCTYDPDDLADPDYELGEREPLAWLIHTPGSQITSELSEVFGCVLLTVGNDRILWLSHDATPEDGAGSYATYTRGESIDFAGHGRSHGDRTRIQNNWIVRGVTAEISKQCTAQAWSKAIGTNPQLGRRRRTTEQSFQSDLIQSEDLAEAIARRLMRLTNRLPDERTTPMVNDPNVHPCTKLIIVDPTYGLGGTTYATVLAVDRTGNQMTLRLSAGPGGDEGTVTHGVDKVCNDTHTDLDWPGDGFDFPDFDFPPIDLGLLIVDPPDDAGWVLTGLLNVVASPPGGSYATAQTVTLTPTYSCTIYFTDDGSTPDTGSTVYTVPLAISTTTTLKFFGQADASHISPVRTEVYTIDSGGGFDCLLDPDTLDWEDEFGPFVATAGQVDIDVDGAIDGIAGATSVDSFAHDSHFHLTYDPNWTATDDWGMNLLLTSVTGDVATIAFSSVTGGVDFAIGATVEPVVFVVTLSGSVHLELVYDGVAETLTLSLDAADYELSTVGLGTGPHHLYLEVFEDTGTGDGTVSVNVLNLHWLFGVCP